MKSEDSIGSLLQNWASVPGSVDANYWVLRHESGTLTRGQADYLDRELPKNGDVPKSPVPENGSLMPSVGKISIRNRLWFGLPCCRHVFNKIISDRARHETFTASLSAFDNVLPLYQPRAHRKGANLAGPAHSPGPDEIARKHTNGEEARSRGGDPIS
jgi:hypothetical protein